MNIGVLADTHIPDQLPWLPVRAMEIFRERSCGAILHAGDICRVRVLHELSEIAPVFAVRGNRDLLWPGNWRLPSQRVVELEAVRIGLVHGQPGLKAYIKGKISADAAFEQPGTTEERLLRLFDPPVSLIVYGHTHVSRVARRSGVLMVNPGSLAPPYFSDRGATLAVVTISKSSVEAEIISIA
jgi:putative phosphoesterase